MHKKQEYVSKYKAPSGDPLPNLKWALDMTDEMEWHLNEQDNNMDKEGCITLP